MIGTAGLLTACGTRLHKFPFDRSEVIEKGLNAMYFSVGCTMLSFGGRSVLTDPFWSHRPLLEVATRPLIHDTTEIDKHRARLKNVSAVLIGHAHYDHCLDLDQITSDIHRDAIIYGSRTLQRIFAKSELDKPIVSVNNITATPEQTGKWLYNSDKRIRVLPILSGHPDQWLCFHLFKEKLKADRNKVPKFVWDYQEGISLAFLVDFINEDTIEKRVYIQTSSTGWPAGFFPESIRNEAPIDAAILAMDCANLKRQGKTPNIIDFLNAKTVMFCHWEDFFKPKSGTPREIVKVDMPDLKRHFQSTAETRFIFPAWNSEFQL